MHRGDSGCCSRSTQPLQAPPVPVGARIQVGAQTPQILSKWPAFDRIPCSLAVVNRLGGSAAAMLVKKQWKSMMSISRLRAKKQVLSFAPHVRLSKTSL